MLERDPLLGSVRNDDMVENLDPEEGTSEATRERHVLAAGFGVPDG